MMFLDQSYRSTAAYDRGLVTDVYGTHSFEEDIRKQINKLVAPPFEVSAFKLCHCHSVKLGRPVSISVFILNFFRRV